MNPIAKNTSDSTGAFSLPSDSRNLALDRSVSNFDQRHNIHATFGWSFPKSLRFSTIFRANSPLPFTVTTGNDDNGDTIFNDRPTGVKRNSERGTWRQQVDASLSWQFRLEKKGAGASQSADPGTEVISGKTIRFVVTATNLFNETNFTRFAGVQTSPFFGQPVAADNPRRIDIGLRFTF